MIDTPKTDAFYGRMARMLDTAADANYARQLGDLCRELERELYIANEQRNKAVEMLIKELGK